MASWTTDLRHVAPPGPDVDRAADARSAFLLAVVEAATSRPAGAPWPSTVRCITRRGRRRCGAVIQVERGANEIVWSCSTCGESGVVTHFADSQADLSKYQPRGKTVLWGFDDEERSVLMAATTHIPNLRAVISRAQPHTEIAGLLYLQATVAELDEMYSLVEELTDGTRSRRRIELLDGLRASLCTSIDGF